MTATAEAYSSQQYLEKLWAQQARWSKAASKAKRQVTTYRRLVVGLIVVAAIAGTASPTIADLHLWSGRVAGMVAGVALAILPFVRRSFPPHQEWSRLRSVSESIKQETFKYLAGVTPYREADRGEHLVKAVNDILSMGDDLEHKLPKADAAKRALPAVHDVHSYRDVRLKDQIENYYRPQAEEMRRRAARVRAILFALGPLAGVLGVLAGFVATDFAPWTGVVGTISGAVFAYSAAARYSFLEVEYAQTASQLQRLDDTYRMSTKPQAEKDDWLVHECEQVISYQNQEWMAELVTRRGGSAEGTVADPQEI